jgi:hypothetical protein
MEIMMARNEMQDLAVEMEIILKLKHNRSSKVAVQGLVFVAHPKI